MPNAHARGLTHWHRHYQHASFGVAQPIVPRRGRDDDYSPPPAQIPASGVSAPGSHLGS
jgi:hypothetical protein